MKILQRLKKKWVRISDLGICCPICGKPDWCRVSENGKYVCCSRVPIYSQYGTIHKVDKEVETKGIKDKAGYYPPINWWALCKSYEANCPLWRINQFGVFKGISPRTLMRLKIGYDGHAYTFPVYDDEFKMVGIQRQFTGFDLTGPDKLMVKGSRVGIFVPTVLSIVKDIYITEGMSDCATLMDMGLTDVVGRLNNSSGTEILVNICDGLNVVIVADNDIAGQNGAVNLGKDLKKIGCKVKIVLPPAPYKDIREWKHKTNVDRLEFINLCKRIPKL